MAVSHQYIGLVKHIGRMLLWGMYALGISILIINAGFLFNRPMRQLGEIHFRSDVFLGLQTRLVALKDVPVPLPHPYLRGLDLVRYRERSGRGWAKVYLLGRFSKEGIKGYYLVASAFKMPISEQVLFLLAIVAYLRRQKHEQFLQNELFLWGPVLFFALYFNFFYRAQIGIRFYLVLFPFIHVFTASLIRDGTFLRRTTRLAIGALIVYMLASVISYFPHYIPYFNELVPDRRLAYRVLADSNLDWGQGRWYMEQYLQRHPEVQLSPSTPVAGTIAVNANHLVGITAEPEQYRWLRENFRPVRSVAYSYLVYQIEGEDLRKIGIMDP
jgi:hypothetical protein